ncbi:C40 family peptidase [Kushneria phyllosphaerae]|uniref:Murein DD-endopeptidase MepS/Murein LD-carboxypeptidase n=1 Tax=Kushneria phyllosphaerae TaxID=2100822 RepID=A0A2R8CH19_9GAMM|nr:C40 family peptidase [Kushneria phyllosphaerae]SPJ32195.1 Murein DD-endopeptidase MepS/Murein LD-carboxypeptidase [Kushneria phyllosphaerae]
MSLPAAFRLPRRPIRRLREVSLLISLLWLAGCAGNPEMQTSDMMGPISEQQDLSIERVLVMNYARDALGIPYRYGGTTPAGMDCSGLTQASFLAAGIEIPRTSQQQFDGLEHIERARPGDLMFFGSGNRVSHVGIYMGNNQMIHAPGSGRHVTIASLDKRYWRSHYRGAAAPAP